MLLYINSLAFKKSKNQPFFSASNCQSIYFQKKQKKRFTVEKYRGIHGGPASEKLAQKF